MALDIEHVGFGPPLGDGYVDYQRAWKLQQDLHHDVAGGARGDTVLLLEHAPVYTAGKRTNSWERPTDGTPVVDVDRGGRITWHGPGQIVGYPITRLPNPVDVVAYVRRVEQLLIETCAELGVNTDRVEGRSGVWVLGEGGAPDRKVAAIGVRVARGVTMHGFALNVENSLAAYQQIVPCGIDDAEVSTLSMERESLELQPLTVADALPVLERKLPTLTGVPALSAEGAVA
jgi:lipoyl(octanoyl) transferase